ncbi:MULTISPECIES: GyrI-like domain-containing protein [Nocardia]|uniref:GyrI-like domain-containing protein n=1 Tax=Nocardia TaxID=1817 RepID=UPI0018E4E5CE|nr:MULTISPECIES: GyrI-like domain-containing protein [Nocardia]
MSYRIAVARSPSHTRLELRRAVRADRAGDDIGAGMRQLYELAARTGLAPTGPPSTTYYGEFASGRTIDTEFGLPVTAGPVGETLDQLTVRRTRPAQFAYTTHRGGYEHIGTAYRELYEWIGASNLRVCGPATEVYLVAPDEAVHPSELVTELRVPVVSASEFVVRVPAPLADAVALVREVLDEHGFVIATEVDLRARLRDRLRVAPEGLLILGVYHPELACRALEHDPSAGLVLLCNLVLRADGANTVIETADPAGSPVDDDRPAPTPIARELGSRMVAVIDTVEQRSPAPGQVGGISTPRMRKSPRLDDLRPSRRGRG